ncbi:MAG: caspase family protein [Steroidobacteraceae bacterium]
MNHRITALLALCTLLAAPLTSRAESRALLVGVGHYQYPGIDLPAIDLDLERMRDALNRLGFDNRQIHVLQDEQATSAAVVREFGSWLREGVRPEDHVVFYFSGHGSNVPDLDGDEEDGVDEVLVTNDMRRATVRGRASLAGVVTDDQIASLLAKIPSRHVLIIVDACHSGTVTRSFTLHNRSLTRSPVFVKSFMYPGMPEGRRSGLTRDLARATPEPNFVSLTAAADGEKAIGTMSGGVFTTGLTQALAASTAAHQPISIAQLRERTTDYIRSKVDAKEVHHPQVTGSPTLAAQPVAFAEQAPAAGPNRSRLLDLAAAQSKHFALGAGRTQFAVDESVKLELTLPSSGWLNIVTVDADDNATVLFPNKLHGDNAVAAGKFTFPTADMKFDLLASEPVGRTLVVAFLSAEPLNFFEETIDDRDEQGNIKVDFPSLSHSATRALRIAPRRAETASAQLELQIVAARPKP